MEISQIPAFRDALEARVNQMIEGREVTEEFTEEIAYKILQVMADNDYPRGQQYSLTLDIDCGCENDCYECEETISLGFFLPTDEEEHELMNIAELSKRYGPCHELSEPYSRLMNRN